MATDPVVLATRIAEAETALHQLATGKQAVTVVDQNGERVEFNRTSMDKLRAYIADLRAQLSGASPTTRRPVEFLF